MIVTLAEAQARVLARFARLAAEDVPLSAAPGRTLAADLHAATPLPPFANSAMDGYALRAADTARATTDMPARLRVVGTVAAGDAGGRSLAAGEAARIMTGAPIPTNADAVIPVERTDGGTETVAITAPVVLGAHIRRAGGELAVGGTALIAGTCLNPAAIALLAALGHATVSVTRRPRVAMLSTGNEIVPPGTPLQPGQVWDANGPLLAALVTQWDGEPVPLSIVRDDAADLAGIIAAARDVDLIVTSGGASVGLFDVVRPLLAMAGKADFTRVRMKPGQPCAFGIVGGVPLLGLPGNPGATFVTFHLLARPALARMLGKTPETPPTLPARLRAPLTSRSDRPTYLRARLRATETGWEADTALRQGAGDLSGLVAADALVILPAGDRDLPAGASVPVHPLHW